MGSAIPPAQEEPCPLLRDRRSRLQQTQVERSRNFGVVRTLNAVAKIEIHAADVAVTDRLDNGVVVKERRFSAYFKHTILSDPFHIVYYIFIGIYALLKPTSYTIIYDYLPAPGLNRAHR